MGMSAVAAYLQRLREGRGLSRAELARQADVTTMVVWRLEVKHGSLQASSLAALAIVLSADIAILHELLLNPTATPDDGQRAAAVALGYGPCATQSDRLDDITLFADLAACLHSDPRFRVLLRQILRAWQLVAAQR
ncbi:MAG TPA: helix-turn-helix transcriptional regulator [Roseiflexaceae bacterium]|nr:helix-turn-helix transcriptional regulator [Roseiflexaceae bacterium]